MRDFNRSRNSDHDRPFGRKSQFGNRFDRPRPTMFDAICSNCGKPCQVPFRPTGAKPVLCRDCFRDAGGSQRRPDEGSFQRPAFQQNQPSQNNELKAQVDALTVKVDKILRILEEATKANNKPSEEIVETAAPIESTAASVKDSGESKEAVEPAPKKKRKSAKKPL